MTACCWPQERGLTSHTLACVMSMPDLYVVGGKDDPNIHPTPSTRATRPDDAEEAL